MKKNNSNKAPQEPSQAKSMVMIPLYRQRVETSGKAYRRRDKHAQRDYRECA